MGEDGFVLSSSCIGKFDPYFKKLKQDKDEDAKPGGTHEKGRFGITSNVGLKGLGARADVVYYSEYLIKNQYVKVAKDELNQEELTILKESCSKSPDNQYIVERINVGCSATDRIEKGEVDAQYLANFIQIGGVRQGVKSIGGPLNFQTGEAGSKPTHCSNPKVISISFTPIADICTNVEILETNFFEKRILELKNKIQEHETTSSNLFIKIKYLNRDIVRVTQDLDSAEAKLVGLRAQLLDESGDTAVIARQLGDSETVVSELRSLLESKIREAGEFELENSLAKGHAIEIEGLLNSERLLNAENLKLLKLEVSEIKARMTEQSDLARNREMIINEKNIEINGRNEMIRLKLEEIERQKIVIENLRAVPVEVVSAP